jgi:hypothetical protein
MLSVCEQAVDGMLKGLGKLDELSPVSTGFVKYLTSRVFFMPSFITRTTRITDGFSQPNYQAYYPLNGFLPPHSTPPITKTKEIIK